MNCFLLELRVVLLEFSHANLLNETIHNIIIQANSNLSSNAVSFSLVGWSFV